MIEIVIGFLGGIFTSWIFWKYLHFLKPDVRVSPQIAKAISLDETQEKRTTYLIKVINMGERQAINVSAKAHLCKLADIYGGKRRITKKIELKGNQVFALGPRKLLGDSWKITPVWYVVLSPQDALEKLVDDNWKVRFLLSATDALSGTTIVQSVVYGKNEIVNGDFGWGLEFDIHPINEKSSVSESPAQSQISNLDDQVILVEQKEIVK